MWYGLPHLDSVKTKLAIQTVEWAVPVTFVYNPRSIQKNAIYGVEEIMTVILIDLYYMIIMVIE
mgnify:CR=1 FL=1